MTSIASLQPQSQTEPSLFKSHFLQTYLLFLPLREILNLLLRLSQNILLKFEAITFLNLEIKK